jgi:hypothetical protein
VRCRWETCRVSARGCRRSRRRRWHRQQRSRACRKWCSSRASRAGRNRRGVPIKLFPIHSIALSEPDAPVDGKSGARVAGCVAAGVGGDVIVACGWWTDCQRRGESGPAPSAIKGRKMRRAVRVRVIFNLSGLWDWETRVGGLQLRSQVSGPGVRCQVLGLRFQETPTSRMAHARYYAVDSRTGVCAPHER